MKIAYIDFNANDFYEDYSISPKKYGGGRIFASAAKEYNKDFHIFANIKSFDNLTKDENYHNCHPLTKEARDGIRRGNVNIERIIPEINQYDLIVHHQVNHFINSPNIPVACWAIGYGEVVHPKNKNLLLYNNYQNTIVSNPETKTYHCVIGKDIPKFQNYEKQDFIFQCTRHIDYFGSIEVAKICNNYQIPVVFAGPIMDGYPLLDHVDGKLIKYIGEISEETKIEYLKKAKLCTFLHKWPTPFNLSAIESLSYGTPIATTRVGFWPSLVNGLNGDFINTLSDLPKIFYNNFKQEDCYQSSTFYSKENMLKSFFDSFNLILKNNL